MKALFHTLAWVLIQSTLHVGFGVFVALTLSKMPFGWKFARTVSMIPSIIAPAAFAVMFYNIFSPGIGLVNNIIRILGFKDFDVNWFFNERTAFLTVTIRLLFYAGFTTILVLAEIASIPDSIVESAYIDGATEFQIDRYIILPLLRNIVGTAIILAASNAINLFDFIFLTTKGGPNNATHNLPTILFRTINLENNIGLGNTIGVIQLMIGILVMQKSPIFTFFFNSIIIGVFASGINVLIISMASYVTARFEFSIMLPDAPPFWEMKPNKSLVNGNNGTKYVLAKPDNSQILIFMDNNVGTGSFTVNSSGTYKFRTFTVNGASSSWSGWTTGQTSWSFTAQANKAYQIIVTSGGSAPTPTPTPAPSGNGNLTVTYATPPGSLNLSAEGTADWAHWGLTSVSSFDHKSGVTQQISNYTKLGTGTVTRYNESGLCAFSWTGGTPTSSATNSPTGIYIGGVDSGFQITVPASTTPQTLKLYTRVWGAKGQMDIGLSDGSAAPYTQQVDDSARQGIQRVYTINFNAASSSQTLVCNWTVQAMYHGSGSVQIQSATLVTASATPTPTPGGSLITNLTVNDTPNAADWSVQSNLQSGNTQYGDRPYAFSSVPSSVAGSAWIRTANDSKTYTGATLVTFKVNSNVDVYVAHNDLITAKPSWLSGWTDTGENIVNNESTPITFSLFRKSYSAGSTVSLGNNGDTALGMYTIIVK